MILATILAMSLMNPTPACADDAWAMFDAVNASSLLPDDGEVKVELIGCNDTGFPYLTDDLITVWDNDNNHYLFNISR